MPYAQAGDVRLYYESFGSGVPFLFVSGTGWPGEPWKIYQVPAFADRYQVIIYDHRGVGRSEAPAGYYSTRQFADDAANDLRHVIARNQHETGELLHKINVPTLVLVGGEDGADADTKRCRHVRASARQYQERRVRGGGGMRPRFFLAGARRDQQDHSRLVGSSLTS